jgi:hypothetical protein
LVAIALTILAMAIPIQRPGCAQTSSYALVRALSNGTAQIDPYQEQTCDKSYRGGHFYSNKAPGLALAILPAYVMLHALGVVPDDTRVALWIFGLWSSVLPAAVLLLLARRIARRFDSGTAAFVAVALGLATLTLPLATVGFGHLLAATLLLGAFAIALTERRADARLLALVGAGALAGFAVTTEYPAALVATVIGIYAASFARPILRLIAFGVGGLIGMVPLLAYNQWAFGSMTSLSYASAVSEERAGSVVIGHHDAGFYGVLVPSLSAVARILLADRGMLTVTPIVVLGVVGIVLLARRGMRAEAAAIGAAGAAMLTYNASLTISPTWVFGGDTPGPRYAYLAIPFVILPLGLVLRRYPSVVVALLAVSLVRMVTATATQPLVGSEGTVQWLRRIRAGDFTNTFLTYAGLGHGWIAILPFLLVAAAAAAAAFASAPFTSGWFSGPIFVTTVAAWAFVAFVAGNLVESTGTTEMLMALGTLAIGCLLVVLASSSESATTSDTRSTRPAG